MEAVLCLPMLLFLVTGLVQFSRIWEAKLMTRHAAYNAARAALVYNVADYGYTNRQGRIIFNTHGGAAWLAAVNTLVWKSDTHHSTRGESADYEFPGFEDESPNGRIDSSAFIRDQVRIVQSQSWESNGFVRVTVQFDFPLLFSIFALGSVQGEDDEDLAPLVHDSELDRFRAAWDRERISHIRLVESCVMPKPWGTAHYPRVSASEVAYLGMEASSP